MAIQATIGFVELTSIAKGIEVSDVMMKSAGVHLVNARIATKGKYFILVTGMQSDVESAMRAALEIGGTAVLDSSIIRNVHPQVIEALPDLRDVREIEAIGIIEAWSVASILRAADAAVKAAQVQIIEINQAKGIGGKAYVIITGEVGAVRSAMNAGVPQVKPDLLIQKVLIPKAHDALRKSLLKPEKKA